MTKTILPSDLIPMDQFCEAHPLSIHLAYKKDEAPNIFGKIYHDQARLWLHKGLAAVVVEAARLVQDRASYSFVLYDGLRTVEAQALMGQSEIVQANPQWLEQPGRLLSPPGGGAHPRGMAIDLSLLDEEGALLDMGTAFDHLAENSAPKHNPAHREYTALSAEVLEHRTLLTQAMMDAAATLRTPLAPLPQEWWDFRLPSDIYNQYAPLSDSDLPPEMRMSASSAKAILPDSPETHFES